MGAPGRLGRMLGVGLLDRGGGEAKIKFVREGRGEDGWYELGEVEVVGRETEVEELVMRGAP